MKESRKGIGSLFNDESFTLGEILQPCFSGSLLILQNPWVGLVNDSEVSEYESSIFCGLAEFFYADRAGHNMTPKFRCLHIDVYMCSMSLSSYFTYWVSWAEFRLPKCRQPVSSEMLQCTGNICVALADLTHNFQEMFDLLKLHLKALWATFGHHKWDQMDMFKKLNWTAIFKHLS